MAIRLEHIYKSFGPVPVLKDVDLEFPEREFITLVGPSGCGKTTLLRILAGLETASSGAIYHGAQRVSDLAPGKRDVAMVFQSYALYPHMNVHGNIGYGLKVRGTPRDEIDRRVREVARVLEIEHLLDRKPKQLSGGQRQRVALGRAMVRKPWLFLMDEPLSNLDAKLRVTMRGELKRFHLRLEATTVYVTHDQLEAMTMSDKIAVMDQGVVQQYATPAEIYDRPANTFVAGFIGSPPMNFVAGAAIADGRVEIACGNGARARIALSPLAAGADRPVLLGVRPQDLRVHPSRQDDAIAARVSLVQLLGSEKLIDLSFGDGRELTAQVKADAQLAVGDAVWLTFDPSRLHLFDPDSGRNLRP
ncbi:MAG TPA: ABC transporter ATP-binding protein [Burkholderiaceae bacterium]|nr:ABC transporter ATP-binding protein [Burkholderiaceae bacterium]